MSQLHEARLHSLRTEMGCRERLEGDAKKVWAIWAEGRAFMIASTTTGAFDNNLPFLAEAVQLLTGIPKSNQRCGYVSHIHDRDAILSVSFNSGFALALQEHDIVWICR